jgi:hypothetical protein
MAGPQQFGFDTQLPASGRELKSNWSGGFQFPGAERNRFCLRDLIPRGQGGGFDLTGQG